MNKYGNNQINKLCITGGYGFIGSNLILYLLKKYQELTILNYDKMTYAASCANLDPELSEDAKSRYNFIRGDIVDEEKLLDSISYFKPDCIMHLAAESHVDNSIASPREFLLTNVIGSDVVLRVGKKLNIRVVQMSTDEVYGSLLGREADEYYAFEPNSPYSVSKAASDLLARAYKVTYNSNINIVRGSNAYGPRQHREKLIPKAITNILQDKPIPLYGNGSQLREWTFTEDFCEGLAHVIFSGEPGEAYNLGSGFSNRVSNKFIAETIVQLMGKDPNQMIQYVTDRPGHDIGYALNSNKLMKLGWQPKTSIQEGLKECIAWYSKRLWA